MKTLVLYATKYGVTKSLAEKIAAKMPGEARVQDVGDPAVDLNSYDTVVLGTPVYMGRPLKRMKAFIHNHMPTLLQKRIGLFLSCLQDESDTVSKQFQIAFPKELRDHAFCLAALGGVVDRNRLNKLDGLIMRMVIANMPDLPKENRVISSLAEDRIDELVELMTKA